ncbi:LuxR family transcriptional regulator [Desulfotalea psychrophila]|uniref:Related to two-component system response regulator n=1 Tax=Desulfotalea psychrophila (strain LSv54 / DSM 12343) TaxID=177439 RepID=Q6AQY0_DESPS|nr:response regulator transcription factor [Desulfotalea psychrophila]CAG35244.1 related to two-component system response regulator [Desulfotalea psychrophila LSv54]
MAIVCLSKDNILIAKLVALYGSQEVSAWSDFHLLPKDLMTNCDALIVDLKDCVVPVNTSCPTPIIVLTGVPTFQEALALLQLNVKGYGNRQMRQDNMRQVVENVKAGQIWLPPSIINQLIATVGTDSTASHTANAILNKLSKREQEVASCVAEGMSNQEIADKMYVSLRTVKAHLSSIYEKTGLRNRLELGLKLKKP